MTKILRISLIVHFSLIISTVSCFKIIEQLTLEKEIEMGDLDRYLDEYSSDNDKPFALLLDYDGTLAPIAAHPNLTCMSDLTKETLLNISSNENVFISIISGRAVDDVKTKVGIDNIIYAGNHGLEILYPNGTRYNHEIPEQYRESFNSMINALQKITRDGSWIENKKFSLTFHYRAMPIDQHDQIRDEAKNIIEGFGYKANQAHCAIEAKPPILWHKGKAAEYILNHNFGDDWREKIRILFAGDDTTDEDIFELLKKVGITFRVTKDPNINTHATYKIPSTESVTTLLQWVDRKFS